MDFLAGEYDMICTEKKKLTDAIAVLLYNSFYMAY
jgi:hypothetical protein